MRRATHRRLPVTAVALAAAAPPRLPTTATNHTRPTVLVERADRYAQTTRRRATAHPSCEERLRLPHSPGIQHHPPAPPARLTETFLPPLPVEPHRPRHRGKRDLERMRNILLPDAAQKMQARHAALPGANILRRMAVDRNQIREVGRPILAGLHGKVATDLRGCRRCHRKGGRHREPLFASQSILAYCGARCNPEMLQQIAKRSTTSENYKHLKPLWTTRECQDV